MNSKRFAQVTPIYQVRVLLARGFDGEDECIGVRALWLVALPTKHRGIASLHIRAQVLRDRVVSMSFYCALKCGVVYEELARVRSLST